MTSEAREAPLGALATPTRRRTQAMPLLAPASAGGHQGATTRGWWGRMRWRLNTMWRAPMTDADLELTAEDIQAELDYGRD